MRTRSAWPWGVVLLLVASGCERTLVQGLDERDANELVAVLNGRGVQATKVFERGRPPTWGLTVASSQLSTATKTLTDLGLPRPKPLTSQEVLSKRSWLGGNDELQSRVLVGLAGDLALTLQAVEGVVSARVHLAVPPPGKADRAPPPAKAAAFLRVHAGELARVRSKEAELAELVAGSVQGLAAENVRFVLDEVPQVLAEPVDEAASPALRALVVMLGGAVALLSTGLAAALCHLRRFARVGHSLDDTPTGAAAPALEQAA